MIRINDTVFDQAYFRDASDRVAAAAHLDRRAGDRFAVCFSEAQDWLAFFFAARAAGASILPLHPSTPYAAARRQAETAKCNWLFYNRLEGEPICEERSVGPGQLLQMSSGTTGEPKCIARAWSDIDNEIEHYTAAFTGPQDMTPLVACPTTHSYGLICGILVALKRGRTPAILDTGNPKFLLRKLRETERPYLISSPAVLHTLARLMPADEKIHATMTSGTLLPEPWFDQIRRKSIHMFQQYGCSEAGCIAINSEVQAANEVGYVLPRFSLRDAGSAGDPKEIAVERAGTTVETRDLGYRREDGMLVFLSRLDDLINVSGLNVYPKEVEDVVMTLEGIGDAVVFRKQDAFAGERVALLFSADRTIDRARLREWCAERLAAHQMPTEIVQVERIPRQANGKISRRDVAARYGAGEFAATQTEAA
ncbi:fatty-acyl-CoA synthase [Mesorhizobium albiziae]|uniref:Fatty-acyl-CoA synthase n=1 Tax=Neomesorhizobium albiziae TaxID=335020 RepID=A0A1I4DZ10_9HYPH|nr:AMP-binding protein [Mesorhizobium albiziae]GLS31195.1 acyl-CoA synthetase [Mesorhizobium albiziae]SFK98822.1 fatty-acyl-CoA synthase [Mesorhizobium albiziae]